jgi:hypothetical protein
MTIAQIRTDDAGEDFDVMKSNDQELTLDDLLEIRKHIGTEGEEPETKKVTTTVSKLTVRLGVTKGA